MNERDKKGYLKASATIELLYILPVIFLIFLVAIYIGFFFHDKASLQGIIYEAAVIGSEDYHTNDRIDEEKLEEFINEKCELRLLFFQSPEINIQVTEEEIQIIATAETKSMEITVTETAGLRSPEEEIREALFQGQVIEKIFTTIWEEITNGD